MTRAQLLLGLGQPSQWEAGDLVTIGRLGRPHGLRGEVSCLLLTDFPERFEDTEWVHLVPEEGPVREVELEGVRPHSGRVLLKLTGVDSVDQAKLLGGLLVAVPEEDLVELEEGEYYHFQLEGLAVVDPEGRSLGTLESVLATPAHETYVVRTPDGEELLIPAVPAYVVKVDLEAGLLCLRAPVMME